MPYSTGYNNTEESSSSILRPHRIVDARRRVWLATPGWRVYTSPGGIQEFSYPDLNDLSAMKKLEERLVLNHGVLPGQNEIRQIILPGPEIKETYARVTRVIERQTIRGGLHLYDMEPEFNYRDAGLISPRYTSIE